MNAYEPERKTRRAALSARYLNGKAHESENMANRALRLRSTGQGETGQQEIRRSKARKIFSVTVVEFFGPDPGAIFWLHFLSSWSQSCAKTQKLRRKKKKNLSFRADFAHTQTRTSSMARWQVFFSAMKIEGKKKKRNYSLARFPFT